MKLERLVATVFMVAMVFVACALGIYFFYNDKEITDAIKANTETK